MHRTHRLLPPLLLAAAVMIVPSTSALAAWQVVTPAGGGTSWYQYPGAASSGGAGAGTNGTSSGSSAGSTSGGTSAGGSGTATGATGGTGGGTTTTTGTTCIGDGWYQNCTPSTTSGSGGTGTSTGATGTSTGGTGTSGGTTAGSTTGGVTLTADEQQLFNTVNQLRTSHGLAPLALNATLVRLAREKSQDMITNNYFSHTSPDLGTPLQMQQNAGLSCQIMGGENIAAAANIGLAIFYFESSPPHMANILYPTYTVTGIGVVADGPYGVYVTEEFAGGC